MAVQIGPKIGIEGEKEYRQQISQIIAQTKQLDSAMEATAATWTKNTSAMTRNKAIAQNLNQQIGLYETKLATMSSLLEASKAKFGENAAQTQRWQNAINDANVSLAMMRQQLNSLGSAAGFSEMSTKIADFGTKMQNVGQSMMAIGQKLTTSLTLPIAALGTASIKLGSDMNEAANKVDVVFGSMSQSVREFAETSTEMYAISEGKALSMAGDFGAMATSMGLSEREAAKLSTEMVALAGDMASFHNKSIDIASNSLKGVFTGETESLKQFGVAMTQTNLDEFASKQGKVYDSMSQAEKVMVRYQYLLESQKDAIGDSGRTMGEFAGSTRQFKAALEDAGAALGQALIPIITPIIHALTELAKMFSNLPKPVQQFIAALLLITAAIGPIILIIGAFVSSLGSIITYTPMVVAAIGQIASALIGMEVAGGPVILIILAIVAALAAAVGVGYAIGANWDSIAAAAQNMGQKISSAGESIANFFKETQKNVIKLDQEIVSFVAALPGKVVDALKNAIKSIADAFDEIIQNAKKSGKDMVEGFVDGIKSKVSKVINEVKKIAQSVKDFLGFSEPDKGPLSNFHTFAPDMMKLFAQGINQNKDIVTRAISGMNLALSGAGGDSSSYIGGTTVNVYVDHISELNDLIRIQNQAQQMLRMGAR